MMGNGDQLLLADGGRSVSLGTKRQMRLSVLSTAPFCHGEFGSQNQLLAPGPSSKALNRETRYRWRAAVRRYR